MIEKGEFTNAFRHICERFGREFQPTQAAAFYQFLAPQMETEQFIAAARAIWATARFFPRPADFLTVAASDEWSIVQECLALCHPPEWKWHEPYRDLSDRAKAACSALGGVPGMKPAYDRDAIRLKTAWEAAYEQATTRAVLALPPVWAAPSLPSSERVTALPTRRAAGGR